MLKKPEYHSHDEFVIRSEKLDSIRALEMDPYPHKFTPENSAQKLTKQYPEGSLGGSEEAAAGSTPSAKLAGRLVLFRAMGKNAFGHIQDPTGRLQIMFNRDQTEVEGFDSAKSPDLKPIKFIEKKLDLGDIIGVEGNLFFTQKGELTLFVKKVTLLCKTLLPLADKHAGLADKEIRYRKRWLDFITSAEVKDTFEKRSRIFKMIRDYCHEQQFMEVETPILQSVYGGAEAKPFETTLHALEQHMFMRISLEIPLKKLIVGGMDRVFEIGRVFRNEGIDRSHNPEFTMLEAYAAYWDYNDMMAFVENLLERLALNLYGTTKVLYQEDLEEAPLEIDLKAPWPRLTMRESIKKIGGIDIDALTDEEMRTELRKSGHVDPSKIKDLSHGLLVAAMFDVFVQPHLIQPHHIIDHPIETTPLCKLHRDPKKREMGLVERFESFIAGHELCNAYSELNDPVLQRSLLEDQQARRDRGDEEASPIDEEFIEAICQGMPPTAGVGIGLDRLVMFLTNSHSIRDVLLFPWMKPLS